MRRALLLQKRSGFYGKKNEIIKEEVRGRKGETTCSVCSGAGCWICNCCKNRLRRRLLFKKEDIESIDRKYFTVIVANEYDITLVSNNTHHVWYIHNVELPDMELCIQYNFIEKFICDLSEVFNFTKGKYVNKDPQRNVVMFSHVMSYYRMMFTHLSSNFLLDISYKFY